MTQSIDVSLFVLSATLVQFKELIEERRRLHEQQRQKQIEEEQQRMLSESVSQKRQVCLLSIVMRLCLHSSRAIQLLIIIDSLELMLL